MTGAFAAGILFERLSPMVPSAATLVGLAAMAALVSLLLARFRHGFAAGALLAFALFGMIRAEDALPGYEDGYRRAPFLRELTGIVISYPDSKPGRTGFTFAPDALPARVRVTVFWNEEEPKSVVYGDRLRLRGSVMAPPRFPDFDYRAYLAAQGVFAVMSVGGSEGVDPLGVGGSPVLRAGNALRDRLLRRLEDALSAETVALARGLLFGDSAGLPDEVDDAFHRTGLSHILAVSGLHLTIFLAGLWFVLRHAGLRPCVVYPIVGASVLLVLWLVGLPVSLVRAAVMFGFLALGSVLADLGFILRRSIRRSHGLAAAGLLILAVRPTALFDVGFQLSFGATAAILAWAATSPERARPPAECPWKDRLLRRITHYGADLAAVSLAAQAGTAPFLAWHFGMLHPLGLLANLVAVPLATLALWAGVAAMFLCATPLFAPLAAVFGALLTAMGWTVQGLAQWPLTALVVSPPIGIWLGGASLYALATLGVVRRAAALDILLPPRQPRRRTK